MITQHRFHFLAYLFLIMVSAIMGFCHEAAGQKDMLRKQKKVIPVNINKQDSSVKTEISPSTRYKKIKADHFYYWYRSDRIFITQGGFDGKLLNGNYSCFYPEGQLKEKGKYYKGQKDGTWVCWYPDGTLCTVSNWNKGVLNGNFHQYNPKGEPVMSAVYKNNLLHGKLIKYENGKIVSTTRYRKGIEVPLISKPARDSGNVKKQPPPEDKKSGTTIIQKIKNYFKKNNKTQVTLKIQKCTDQWSSAFNLNGFKCKQ